jgi:hypothetical protein
MKELIELLKDCRRIVSEYITVTKMFKVANSHSQDVLDRLDAKIIELERQV